MQAGKQSNLGQFVASSALQICTNLQVTGGRLALRFRFRVGGPHLAKCVGNAGRQVTGLLDARDPLAEFPIRNIGRRRLLRYEPKALLLTSEARDA